MHLLQLGSIDQIAQLAVLIRYGLLRTDRSTYLAILPELQCVPTSLETNVERLDSISSHDSPVSLPAPILPSGRGRIVRDIRGRSG